MPKRTRKTAISDEPHLVARATIEALIGEPLGKPVLNGKDPLAVELGRRGGKKGGKARAKALTPEQRSASASKAAQARWAKKNKTE